MTWQLQIQHVAGILEGDAEIEPGLNAVRGSNWQGKSSFIEAIEVALGASTALTEGRERGAVHLETPDRDVTVELVRDGRAVHRSGTPLLEDEYDVVRTDLFACLDERNEIRAAVRNGRGLKDALLRPLDFENLDEQIADLKRERERVESELTQAEEAKKRLPKLQQRVTQLRNEIEDLRERREELSATGETDDAEASESAQQRLRRTQTERNRAENQIERLERSIERTEERLDERRAELEDLDVKADDDVESDLAAARAELQRIKRESEVLQSVYSATELVLEEDRIDLVTDVEREIAGDSVECWTCGETVDRKQFEKRLETLGERITDRRARIERYRDEVEQLEARREEIEQSRRRKRDLESEISDLEAQLADRRQSLEDARDRLEDAERRIEELSDAVDRSIEAVTDVESEIKYREAELKDAENELEELEARADQFDTLEEEHRALGDEIEALRNRKEEIERRSREAFDEAIGDLVERFETGFESARLTADFELVVARDGREADLEALSEGELELLGIVAALAGYEAFDVDEVVPILLLDGVGGLADDNLHTLVEYLRDRTEYLVFTAYPEYAAFDGREIDPSDWIVTSDRRSAAE